MAGQTVGIQKKGGVLWRVISSSQLIGFNIVIRLALDVF